MTWPTVKLRDVCVVKRGTTITEKNAFSGIFPVVAGGVTYSYTHNIANRKGNVITISGSGANAGYVNYWREPIFASDCSTVEADNENIDIKYVFFFLKKMQIFINSTMRSGAAQPHVYAKDIALLEMPLPPLAEQQRIAAILDKAEDIKRKREQAIAKLDEFAQSTFVEMFGDPIKNTKNWDMVELKQFGKIVTGNTPSRNDLKNYDSNFVEWIKTDNITEESIFITHAREHLSKQGVKIGRTVKKGALLVACIAGSLDSIGRASLTDREVAFNQQINAIQPYEDINPLYLYNLFKASRTYIQSHASSGMKKLLSKGEFEKIKMIRPPISLQNQFVATIERVNHLSNRITAFDERTNLLIASLQHQAFTTGFRA